MKTAIKRAAEQGTSTTVIVKKGKTLAKTKSKKQNVRQKVSVNLGLGLPRRLVITHKFVESGAVTSTLGVFNSLLYSCNGMFNPRPSGSSQPFYFDQLAALYDHYTVIGSRIKVTALPGTVDQDLGALVVMLNDDTTASALTSVADAAGQTQATPIRYISGASSQPTILNLSWSAKKLFGGSILGNDNLQGTASANPSEATYFQIFYQTLKNTTTSVYVAVEIEYIAVWDELKEIGAS